MISPKDQRDCEIRERRISAYVANIHYAATQKAPLTVWYAQQRLRLGPSRPPPDGVIVGTYTQHTPLEWIREDLEMVLADEER